MNIEQKAITLIKEIENRHHTPSKVMGSSSFEQELMDEKIDLVKKVLVSVSIETVCIIAITQIILTIVTNLME